MANEIQISKVVDAIITAFAGDMDKFGTFLVRSSLEMDKLAVDSAIRKEEKIQTRKFDKSNENLQGLQAQRQAIVDKIDAI